MKPTPEQVERAREIVGIHRIDLGSRGSDLIDTIAQALADEAERARRDQCYSEYKRGFDEGYAQGTPEENAELQSQLATLQKLCEEQKSQLATQTEITEDWKKKYEEYSTYCIALVDCEKEKATQTERIKRLENALNKAHEWACKYPLQGEPSTADMNASNDVRFACQQALQDTLGDGGKGE